MLGKLLAKDESTRLRQRITQRVVGSFGIKVASLGLAFITNVLLARLLGASGYGTYIYAFTWAGFLAILPSLGLTEYVIREVAVYQAQAEWGLLNGLLRWSNLVVLFLSVMAALLAAIAGWFLGITPQSPVALVFWIALVMIPPWNLTALRQGVMKGLNKVVLGDFPELLIRPILFLGLLGAAYIVWRTQFDAAWVMGLYVLSVGVSFSAGAWMLFQLLPAEVKASQPVYQPKIWLRNTLPFLLIVCMFIVNQQTDVLMLGAIKGHDAAGIYTVVGRGVQLIQFALAAVCAATGPTIAALYATQDIPKLKRVMRGSVRLLGVGAFAIAISLILFGHLFLSIFGAEFVQGQSALTILSLGYLLDAPTGGLAGLLLLMTGNERDTALGTGITAVLNVVLNSMLIPLWGLEGAAIATTISTLVRSLFFMVCTRKKLGFFPSPL
jgi:O-antigen/teichoic acid export membrane protein